MLSWVTNSFAITCKVFVQPLVDLHQCDTFFPRTLGKRSPCMTPSHVAIGTWEEYRTIVSLLPPPQQKKPNSANGCDSIRRKVQIIWWHIGGWIETNARHLSAAENTRAPFTLGCFKVWLHVIMWYFWLQTADVWRKNKCVVIKKPYFYWQQMAENIQNEGKN